MRMPLRLSVLFLVGMLAVGSTALGYYYYYVYSPPLELSEAFLDALEEGSAEELSRIVLVLDGMGSEDLRPPTSFEVSRWLREPFERGRILDQRRRSGQETSYHYLVYREPDGQIYALMAAEIEGLYRIVVPREGTARRWYLWEYTWTN